MGLTREDLANGAVQAMIDQWAPTGILRFLTTAEREASLQATLAAAPPGDLWLFGYGSLMWNPAFLHEERMIATVHGWHRRFCLWTPVGRGSPEAPGLVLALEPGGSCRGVAFRLDPALAEAELRLVWLREMLTGAYRPRWSPARLTDGRRVTCLSFMVERSHERYAGRLSEAEIASAIAAAAGHLGPCRDYLAQTLAAMEQVGVRAGALHRLSKTVAQKVAEGAVKPAP